MNDEDLKFKIIFIYQFLFDCLNYGLNGECKCNKVILQRNTSYHSLFILGCFIIHSCNLLFTRNISPPTIALLGKHSYHSITSATTLHFFVLSMYSLMHLTSSTQNSYHNLSKFEIVNNIESQLPSHRRCLLCSSSFSHFFSF